MPRNWIMLSRKSRNGSKNSRIFQPETAEKFLAYFIKPYSPTVTTAPETINQPVKRGWVFRTGGRKTNRA